eukprot:3911981-Amphidinium_carterae.3
MRLSGNYCDTLPPVLAGGEGILRLTALHEQLKIHERSLQKPPRMKIQMPVSPQSAGRANISKCP